MELTPREISERGGVAPRARWRAVLRRHLAWLLLIKVAALALLWALFFSPGHRTYVDTERAARQLQLGSVVPAAPAPVREERPRD